MVSTKLNKTISRQLICGIGAQDKDLFSGGVVTDSDSHNSNCVDNHKDPVSCTRGGEEYEDVRQASVNRAPQVQRSKQPKQLAAFLWTFEPLK